MKILLVMERRVNAGSIQAAANYVRVGAEMGHEIAVYGRSDPAFPHLRCSIDVERFDYVLFIVESRLDWMTGLKLSRIVVRVPRSRRAVLDADGMYNRLVVVNGYDRNHPSERDRQRWLGFYDELGDRVLQPTPQPLESQVIPLLFYGYDPASRLTGNGETAKRFDIVHVGHNWWRWQEVGNHLLPSIERIRSRIGKIGFLGLWWDAAPPWAAPLGLEAAFQLDFERLRRLDIEVHPPVPYLEVIPAMSLGRINVMTQRPLLRHLRLTTSKYFEIFCADTIPLLMLTANEAERVYGAAGRELALDGNLDQKLIDVLDRPAVYRELVEEVRSHLLAHHSYRQRVQELVSALAD
ncbi:MAG TPA: hypothetical protein VKE51_42330 [Vicinamibacterales bacterium]|nr:hypothetical protein [Vicinamibacterales bacterium]